MTIDEEALDVALKKHLCSDHKPCRIAAAHLIKTYEQAKKPVMGTAHVDGNGNVTVVPNSTNTALVQKLAAWIYERKHFGSCDFMRGFPRMDCSCGRDALLTEANAWLKQQEARGE